MKTKTILWMMIALFLLVGGMGCEKEEDSTVLTGTRWELAGITDVKTKELKTILPEGSYWFKFISETQGKGQSVLNVMTVNLTTPPFFNINTMIGDDHNGDAALFYEVIKRLESYEKEGNTLKFFYDNNQYYLLYTPSNYKK